MVGGFVVTVAWVLLFKEGFYDLYEMIPGGIAGFACCIGVSLMTDADPATVAERHSVRDAIGPVF